MELPEPSTPIPVDGHRQPLRAPAAYALALAALAAAVLLRYALDPWMGPSLPLVTLFGAVAATAWFGGPIPAALVTILGYLACNVLFIDPRGDLTISDLADAIGLIPYLFTCFLIIAFGESARRAERRVAEQREVLRITLHSIGDAVIATDVQGRITYLSAVAESLTGWTQAEALGRPLDGVFRIVNEDTRHPVESPAARALREGVVVGLANHTVLIRKDGGECAIDDSAAPIRDDSGAISGCVLIFRDVTTLRHVERERASQLHTARLLASIIESSDDAIISKSLDGVIRSWNAGAERLFGHTADEAIGRHISLIIPPERIAEEDQIIASLKAGRRIEHFETERLRSDGRRILVSLTISPIRDDAGDVVGASKIVRDVTRQREIEQRERQLLAEAAAANAKFQAFFDQGAFFAGIMDVNGILLDANRLSVESPGFTTEQFIGKPFWEGPWWAPSPALREQIEAATRQAAAGQSFGGELPYFVADGSQRMVDLSIQPIRDATGRVIFLAPLGVDITERKRGETDRQRLEDDLRRLAVELSEADRHKNEFLAMLAHELRNPLAPISNAVRALQAGVHDAATLRSASGMLHRQVGLMSRLVDDLLDMSRITRGKIELRKERIELAPIVHQAVEAVRDLYRTMEHQLTVTLPPQPVHLDADPARLTQVIGNLLHNAGKFTDKGGQVWLTVEADGAQAVIRVRDNGVGIAPEHHHDLFTMFGQIDTSLERSRGGLGIGLTLVKTLVDMHGGEVEVQSDGPGHGTEFTVRLPVSTQAPRAAAPPAEPVRAARRRVLIVDDSEDGAESLAMLLEFGGHETYKAHDGLAAMEAVERLRPDAVLLDIGLPGLNGYEVCRRIRQASWGKRMTLVALTGWGQDEDRDRSRAAGFDAHMVKPVDVDALLALLAAVQPVADAESEVGGGRRGSGD